jgi:hypothetical protein
MRSLHYRESVTFPLWIYYRGDELKQGFTAACGARSVYLKDSKMVPTARLVLALPDNASGKIHENKKLQKSEFFISTNKARGNTTVAYSAYKLSIPFPNLHQYSELSIIIALAL